MSNKWVFSATEIDTFDTCQRKWGYRYLDEIITPPSKAAEFGSAVHSFLQKYLTGNPIEYGTPEDRVTRPGLEYLPKGLSKENVERQIFFSKNGHIFQGYIDFFEAVGSQKWLIGDHKTSSSLTDALSPDTLKRNIQANVYAQWAFLEKDAEEVTLKWVYYRTKSTPKAICVETTLTQQEADINFEPITQLAEEIKKIVESRAGSSSLPKNEKACFKYGPCPFYARCRPKSIQYQSKVIEVLKVTQDPKPSPEVKESAFHLYVDCIPMKNEAAYERTIMLADLLKPVLQKIQTEKGLSHYRFMGYGQHVALIADYLRQHLENTAYDHRTAIFSTVKTPEGSDTLETLESTAGRVVRGI